MKRGLTPGLCFANELVNCDEVIHCDFACHLHNKLLQPASPIRIRQIIENAVETKEEFNSASLPVSLIGIDAT